MVSIKEIAKYTGASPTTVSNVIHGRTNKVSKEKFKQIQAALEKFNYSEQMAGRILANNGSRIIGFIIQDNVGLESREFSNPYIGELTQAIEYYVRQRGYYLIYHRSISFDESLRVMQSWQMEGVVLSGVQPNELVAWHQYLNTPAVFLDAFEDQASGIRGKIKNVGLDDRAEAKKMTEFLIDAGHRDIAFLSRGTVSSLQGVDAIRRDGVIAALKKHKLPVETAIIGLPVFMTELDEWLAQFIKQKFNGKSALFFSSDLLASYALSRIQSAGVSIPDDISIVGFDGNILSQVSFPKLTTIFQDLNLKADQAINLLFKQINQEEILQNNIRIEGKLLERDSVKYN